MEFSEYMEQVRKKHSFVRFDSFIIEKMGYDCREEDDMEKIRHQAFREFRKRMGRQNVASMPTMRRWFGMNGYRKPSREQVYEICFALKLNREQTEEYLMKGLGEPSFQINDYQELIFLYGLENHRTFQECIRMMERFEHSLDVNYSTSKTHSTKELRNQFEASKHMEVNDFLLWMLDRADWFKGYSQTTLDYFHAYKKNIIEEIRKEEKTRLDELLGEAGYNRWISERKEKTEPNSRESIEKFVKNYEKSSSYNVSESLGNAILELAKDVYSDKYTNVRLISEVFEPGEIEQEGKEKISARFVKTVSEKYLSDLFRMPEHREMSIRIAQAKRKLAELPQEDACPDWAISLIGEIYREPLEVTTTGQGLQILEKAKLENGRRCLAVQRGDLLLLIHKVAQQRYLRENKEEYRKSEAGKVFCDMANATMNACCMAELSEEYEMDAILLACYGEEEMYSFNDVLTVYQEDR